MEIPKKIDMLLKRRTKLAEQLAVTAAELDKWLEAQGMDLVHDSELWDSTSTGCMIYCEPCNAEKTVREAIEKFEK